MGLFDFNAIKNHPRRSGFDLSRRICFTSKSGELLPVWHKLVYPGDKFKIKSQLFTRTQPVNTAAYTRIREYLDFYFVPLRLINKNLPTALVQMQDNPVQASGIMQNKIVTTDLPWVPFYGVQASDGSLYSLASLFAVSSDAGLQQNMFGFNSLSCSAKLLMYLRFGNFLPRSTGESFKSVGLSPSLDLRTMQDEADPQYSVNILPLAAYQKIYADFFRYTQWEKNEPYTYNFDWYAGGNILASLSTTTLLKDYFYNNNLFTLRYSNWPKDQFTGILPNSQLGEVSVVSLSNVSAVNSVPVFYRNSLETDLGVTASNSANSSAISLSITNGASPFASSGTLRVNMDSIESSFDILQLRMAEAVQKYREVSQFADQDARSQIMAHFGVSLSPVLSDKCMYVGGSVSNLDISEVINQNLQGDGEATLSGKGVGSGSGSYSFSSDEYGVLMAIYHNSPILDYVITGQPQDLLYTNTADLPFPEFDNIGMQTIQFGRMINSSVMSEDFTRFTMGYLPRFYDLKTDYDEVFGAFRSTLKNWVAPLDPSYLQQWFDRSVPGGVLNYGFFKTNPCVLDSIFNVKCDSTIDTDQFLSALYLDVKAVRNFDYDGMPY